MSIPKNPETIILKNEYYPSGLREIDIWDYYQKIKDYLLKETLGKSLIVFFTTELNKTIVIRKSKTNGLIRLSPSNYNEIVSGRTLSFHSVMDKYSDFGIIDIDIDDFEQAKKTTLDMYNILNNAKFITDLKIRFTGKNSFHIKANFKNDYPIEYIRKTIYDFLIENNVDKKYTISHKRTKNIPNIDLNRNVYNAGYITLYSLSVMGLKCMEVNVNHLNNFKRDKAKI
jgi:hypothetical protein